LSEEDLVIVQKSIQTPFIADYIRKANEQTIAKIEANKKQTGFVLNETPKTEGDELFASIMKKYKGKVVYVDFWATWCGPCRSGIEEIKPLKEEMAGENVAFVYLTNQTSPENTYSAMISEIKGEHYRLSADQWNYLAGKFNISGIPHYVLAGKNGEVINPKLGHMSNEQLKTELEKRIKE
jgi:thiol-disulfide isomerase/thioredoxin